MLSIIYRVVLMDPDESEAVIASGEYDWLCQDWRCPARDHCGKHFGLSRRYAAMLEQREDEALVVPARTGRRCRHYERATRDHFAESLGQPPRFPRLVHERLADDPPG